MSLATRWIDRIDAGDRGLLDRVVIGHDDSRAIRRAWIAVTHAGSAAVTIGAVIVPVAVGAWPRTASWRAALTLALSHGVVQLMKRHVCRARPLHAPIIRCPDRFSFPSGHAAAALAVAAAYAMAFPAIGVPVVGFALLVGWSRVMLGVHYPGDVIVGQVVAVVTAIAVRVLVPPL